MTTAPPLVSCAPRPAPRSADLHPANWRLEHLVTELLLECETGYIAGSHSDGSLNYIFNRRTGPISAALAISTQDALTPRLAARARATSQPPTAAHL